MDFRYPALNQKMTCGPLENVHNASAHSSQWDNTLVPRVASCTFTPGLCSPSMTLDLLNSPGTIPFHCSDHCCVCCDHHMYTGTTITHISICLSHDLFITSARMQLELALVTA